jgi:hypothetical protein
VCHLLDRGAILVRAGGVECGRAVVPHWPAEVCFCSMVYWSSGSGAGDNRCSDGRLAPRPGAAAHAPCPSVGRAIPRRLGTCAAGAPFRPRQPRRPRCSTDCPKPVFLECDRAALARVPRPPLSPGVRAWCHAGCPRSPQNRTARHWPQRLPRTLFGHCTLPSAPVPRDSPRSYRRRQSQRVRLTPLWLTCGLDRYHISRRPGPLRAAGPRRAASRSGAWPPRRGTLECAH